MDTEENLEKEEEFNPRKKKAGVSPILEEEEGSDTTNTPTDEDGEDDEPGEGGELDLDILNLNRDEY